MKKKHLTDVSIADAGLRMILFISTIMTGSFAVFPTAGIAPIADLHSGEMPVITGTANPPPFILWGKR